MKTIARLNILLLSLAFMILLILPTQGFAQDQDFLDYASGKTWPAHSQERTKKFSNYKFGLFVHWGLYSIPAGKWIDGRIDPRAYSEQIQNHLKITFDEYSQLVDQFNPVEFDADQWISYIKSLGMKYIVITAKHHDGFAMYDSDISDYDVMASPFKRDIMKELKEACVKHDIGLGFYYSHSRDWEHPHGFDNPRTFYPDLPRDFTKDLHKQVLEKSLPQTIELLKKYQPDVMWFDTPRGTTPEEVKLFGEAVRKYAPNCVINSRLAIESGHLAVWLEGRDRQRRAKKPIDSKWELVFNENIDYISLKDKGIPSQILHVPFESPDSISSSYGYRLYPPHKYHTGPELITRLVKTTARGGNYLLNIGPNGKGGIPEKAQSLLDEVGAWMKINSEAIHNTQPNPFNQLFPWGEVSYNPNTNNLYLLILRQPREGYITIPALSTKIKNLSILGSNESFTWEQKNNVIHIPLKTNKLNQVVPVLKLQLEGVFQQK
ncbi:alpha-L-fucosidase [Poriferisphaera sp. WC338]|uniref:alpha-L-fucosidase n=1 Tax=Poriferisphaera sp. WC338 TaxID=3425129 RepID=UPI003D81420F